MALPFTFLKSMLRQKERIMETQIFHHAKIYLIFKEKSSKKKPKIFQDIY
jgi:hypothetical protein